MAGDGDAFPRMTADDLTTLVRMDKEHVWHPFTPMRDWCAEDHEPLFIVSGEGAWLTDQHGVRRLDGNSTIWTCIHGHRHPRIEGAIQAQLERIAHVSGLGFANEPAARLAAALAAQWPAGTLTRTFFSDDGSTAVECALKMALQYFQQTGEPGRRRFAAFDLAYHGDTMGAAALGGIAAFHDRFRGYGAEVTRVASMEALEALPEEASAELAAVIIEPLIQGAAGMRLWPSGMLRALRAWCDARGVLLIADEVMTGFGRTGRMFACQHEDVVPDMVALAKGLTGGYLPLAATMTSERIFRAFLGAPEEGRTFYYGHSYSGHPLGCAAALANLALFEEERTLERLVPSMQRLAAELDALRAAHPRHVGEVRRCGFIAGVDVMEDAPAGRSWPAAATMGARICAAARRHGLLTRPVRDTLVLMLPLCCTPDEVSHAVRALGWAITDVCGPK